MMGIDEYDGSRSDCVVKKGCDLSVFSRRFFPGPRLRHMDTRFTETTLMSWLHIGLIGAIVFALHSFQQTKMTLKDKGYHVDLMTGWMEDYRKFKQLTQEEPDEETRYKYQRILNGLYLALAGLVVIPLLILTGK